MHQLIHEVAVVDLGAREELADRGVAACAPSDVVQMDVVKRFL
jgi:hypothetical protein